MPTKNNSPNLDQYIPEGRKRYVSYYEGAQMYGFAYTGFVKACKEAGANKKIRKTVMVDLDRFEEYLEEQYKEHGTERVRKDGNLEDKMKLLGNLLWFIFGGFLSGIDNRYVDEVICLI